MANSFSKQEMVLWSKICEGYENRNLTAQMVDKWDPGAQSVGRAGGAFRYVMEDQAEIVSGIDVSGQYKDKIEASVAVTLGTTEDVRNAPWAFTAFDANDPTRHDRAVRGSVKKISSDIDTRVQEAIVKQGCLVNAVTTDITKYDELALASQSYAEIEHNDYDSHMLVPPKIARKVTGGIANRSTMNDTSKNAYENGIILDVDGIPTYKSNVTNRLGAATGGAVTVNGANQNKTLVAWRSDKDVNPLAAGEVDDIRYQTLTVAGTSLSNGDVFTIDGVNRVGLDTKKDTETPMTFRVISGGGTTTPVISPAIISTGAYQNVSAAPADAAPITKINGSASNPVVHWDKSAVVWVGTEFNVDQLQGSMAIESYTTDSGINLLLAKQGGIDDMSAKFRLIVWGRPNVVDPMKAGIILPNQTTAIG